MHARRFAALTRTLHAAATRRGLSGVLAVLLSLLGVGAVPAPDAQAKNARRRGKRKKKARGPCAPGKSKKNTCKKDRNCCTTFCKKGRCRCRKPGQSCTEDRNCCPERTGRTCIDGACQAGPTCAASCPQGCCAGQTCQPGTSEAACGHDGAACQVCRPGDVCRQGACVCGDVCASGCPQSNLQRAIAEAPAGATLRLCAEPYPTPTITCEKNVTLAGAGDGENETALDGQQLAPVLVVQAGVRVGLAKLRIRHGQTANDGAGIFNAGDLTLTTCTLADNTAGRFGGGLYNATGAAASLQDCTVSDNEAEAGGGILNFANGLVNLTNSTVTGNTADDEGGGIYNQPMGTVNLFDDSLISGNTPDNCAGDGDFTGVGCQS